MTRSTPTGALRLRKVPLPPRRPVIRNLDDVFRYATPRRLIPFWDRAAAIRRDWQRANLAFLESSLADQQAFDERRGPNRLGVIGHLWLTHLSRDGVQTDLGLASCRVVTDVGVGYIVDAFQNLTELENMRYHGLGTGGAAEAAGNTALTTELTTQYSSSNTRPTGSIGEKSGDAKTYETSATITVSASVAATEHGVFNQAATGGGVLLDRSLFTVVNLANAESIQATYQLTFPSGS